MDVNKIIDFVDVWAKTIGLTSSKAINTVKNDIIKRCDMYKKAKPFITVEEDNCSAYIIKPKDSKYSLEDFFLNRLMLGLRKVEISKLHGDGSSAEYDSYSKSIQLYVEDYKKSIDDKATRHSGLVGQSSKIITKTFEHELGHCFKASFTDGIKAPLGLGREQDVIYEKLIENLLQYKNGKYSNEIRQYNDMLINEYSDHKKTGLGDSGFSFELLDEMVNEAEALRLTDSLEVQEVLPLVDKDNRVSSSGNHISVYNYSSGYACITQYGEIFRSIIGKKNCFNAEYISSKEILQKFNRSYSDIAQNVYGVDTDKTSAIDCVIYDINQLVNKNNGAYMEENILRLDEFFASCYQKKVNKALEKGVSSERKDSILKDIEFFKSRMTSNPNKEKNDELKHVVIFNEIRAKLKTINKKESEEQIEIFDVDMSQAKDNQQEEIDKARQAYEELSQPIPEKATQKELEEVRKIYEDDFVKIDSTSSFTQSAKLKPGITKAQVEEQKRKEDQERYRKEQQLKQQQQLEELKQLQEAMSIYEDESYNPMWYMNNENSQRHGMRH